MSQIVKKTGCPLNCIDGCQWLVTLEGEQVVDVRGGIDNPVTKGFVCSKAQEQLKRAESIERVLYPMYRQNPYRDQWQRISWDEAYRILKEQLTRIKNQYGTAAWYHHFDYGSNGLLRTLDRRFFNAYGGATEPIGSLCWGSGYRAQEYDFGDVQCSDWSDLVNGKTIILWGRDPAVTSIHMVPYLQAAREKGGKVIVINPLEVKSVKFSDKYISVKPGTDGALALGIAHVILERRWLDLEFVQKHVEGFEKYAQLVGTYTPQLVSSITDVSQEDIVQLARDIAKNKPTSIIIGYGMQRYLHGGKAVRAIDSLLAITGNIGIPGGCAHYAQGGNGKLLNKLSGTNMVKEQRFFPVGQVAEHILAAEEPPIKGIFVTRSNPVTQLPNTTKVLKAFEQAEFVAVVDFFINDTADRANLILPAATVFEDLDLISTSWNNYLTLVEPVLPTKGQAKPDWRIFSELAVELELEHYWPDSMQELSSQLKAAANMDKVALEQLWTRIGYGFIQHALSSQAAVEEGLTLERLQRGPVRNPLAPQIAWADLKFSTPSGKYELFSQLAQREVGYGLPQYMELHEEPLSVKDEGIQYPYVLLTPHREKGIHSQFALEQEYNWPVVKVHPHTAEQLYVSSWDQVMVETPYGQLRCLVEVTAKVRPDTVVVEEGSWLKWGGGVNQLTPDLVGDMGLGTPYYQCRCLIKKIVDDFSDETARW